MANRRSTGNNWRSDFGRNNRGNNFGRSNVSPWQDGGIGPASNLPSLLPLAAGSTEATLALASNIINLLQPRQNTVPSLLDMPMQRDFGPNMNRYNRGYNSNKMGNQGNFRRTGTYPRSGDRMGNRRPNRPSDGPRHQRKSSPKKDSDSKTKPVKESTHDKDPDSTEKTETTEGTDEKKNRFDDIDPKLLFCHICNKSMWDGRSFENHLNGRAHAIMMHKTAESYALTADTIRQELKIREMKRTRKTGQQMPRDFYCAMCDLYAADGPEHRTTVGHRKLKKYLHPACMSCHKEMPTRIELDEHRLTPEHMRKIQVNPLQEQPEVMQIYTLSMETSYVRENPRRSFGDRKDKKKDADDNKDEGEKEQKDDAEEGTDEKTEKKPEDTEEKIDSENTVLDFKEGDDLTALTAEMVPKYSPKRGVGRSFLTEFRCVQCKLCNKLLDSDETAEVHLKTWRHHRLFARMLMKNIEPPEKETQEAEEELEPTKRSLPTEESGNWKRRKTTISENDEQNGHDDDDMKDESNKDGGDEEMPAADGEANGDEPMNEEAIEKEEVVVIKKEKDAEVEVVQVKQEVKEDPPSVEEKKGKPAARGRGRGRRSTRI